MNKEANLILLPCFWFIVRIKFLKSDFRKGICQILLQVFRIFYSYT